jgi:uncharacterized protein
MSQKYNTSSRISVTLKPNVYLSAGGEQTMNYQGAADFALKHLQEKLPAKLPYHDIDHTRSVVVPATSRLAAMHNLSHEETHLLLTAAWFHDTGFSVRYEDNERFGAQIAGDVLPTFGYSPEQIARVQALIMATQISHKPQDTCEAIIADADLDMLGRSDFLISANNLREEERDWRDTVYTDPEWYSFEMRFLTHHRYHTVAQRRFRNNGKVRNYLKLARMLYNSGTGALPHRSTGDGTQPLRPY